VGGLLLEGQFVAGRLTTAILGIGINVNIKARQIPVTIYPATSLLVESGRMVPRAELLGLFLASLESAYEAAAQGQSPQADWEKHLITLGHRVRLSQSGDGETLTGIAERVDDWGRLIVRDDTGRRHAYSAGDVTLQVDNSGD
jgi:BirA family biotin operon repressor/biotin-[acetyl-CoA-carboxylase] ligase